MSAVRRRHLLATAGVLAASLLVITGCSSAPEVPSTGETTEVTVTVQGMHFVPDVIEVPVGNELVVTFENTGTDRHDLVFANGAGTAHLPAGASEVIDVGVIAADLDGWCSVSNHRAMGMELTVRAID